MKVTKTTRTELVETYEVNLPGTATDSEILEAIDGTAPIESARRAINGPQISRQESASFEDVFEVAAIAHTAFELALERARPMIEEAVAAGMSERQIAKLLGRDRGTIRRWRGKVR